MDPVNEALRWLAGSHMSFIYSAAPREQFVLFALACLASLWLLLRMGPKRFYFIRHGQTVLNAQHIKQGAEGALNEKGKEQAGQVGAYLSSFPIRTIYSSPYERARQTADIIAAHTHAHVHTTPLLAERRNPSEVIGKPVHDPEVIAIVSRIERGYHENDFRYSDEENFEDLKARARKCLTFLRRHLKSHAVVVTHHAFLQMLLSYMLYRRGLSADHYVKLAFFNPAENGGITICDYHPWKRFSRTRGWEIIAYNETVS